MNTIPPHCRSSTNNDEGKYSFYQVNRDNKNVGFNPGVTRTIAHLLQLTRDMTIFSRNGSIGGLVTWANNCLKYSNRRGLCRDRHANGVSLPIDPSASFLQHMVVTISKCTCNIFFNVLALQNMLSSLF